MRHPRRLALLAAHLMLLLLTTAGIAHAQPVRQDFWAPNGTVNAAVVSGSTLYVGGEFRRVGPVTGSGVPIDAATGAPLAGFPPVDGCVYAAASDGAGGWYIGGAFTAVGGLARTNLAHVLSDMTLAPWDPQPNNTVAAIAVSAGVVYFGGFFTQVAGQNHQLVAAVDAVTGAPTAFDANATRVGFDSVRAIVVRNGVVYVGGQFSSMGGQNRVSLAALDATTGDAAGSWDAHLSGGIPDVTVLSMAASPTTLYLCGNFSSAGGQGRSYIAALDLGTALATSWDAQSDDEPLALALSANGSLLYVGGQFRHIGGQDRQRIAALDAATANATSWDPGADDIISVLAVSGGVVYAGGSFTTLGGSARGHAGAIDAVSALATSWNPYPDQWVGALSPSGSAVYVGGIYRLLGGVERHNLAAFDIASGTATAWNPDADGAVLSLALHGSVLYAGGAFASVGGASRAHVAALDLASAAATAWDPGTDGTVEALAADDTVVYLGGSFNQAGGLVRNHLAQIDATTGQTRTGWDANADAPVHALALDDTRLFVGGSFQHVGGFARNYIAALQLTDGSPSDWNPNADFIVDALLLNGTTIYVGGQFGHIGGQARNYAAALSVSSGLASAWNPNPDGAVYALAMSGPTIYAGGEFTTVGGNDHTYLVAVDANTGADGWGTTIGTTLCPGGDPASVRAVTTSGPTVFAGGTFTDLGPQPRGHLVALSDVFTAVQVSLMRADAWLDRVRLEWFVSGASSFAATLYRREAGGAWQVLGVVTSDGSGQVVYEDRAVTPGARYDYRLGVASASGETFYGEASVTMPAAAAVELALSGTRPNPARGDLMVEFSLPDAASARLELLDVSGRRLMAREVGVLGAGRHTIALAPERALAPGVYLLRLTRGGRSLTVRTVVVG